jgi:uncharacterized protein (UPF0332 family)
MNPEFKRCLERKKIVPFEKGHTLVEKELRTAHEDLEVAKRGLSFEKYKWPTIQAYYSQFHSARALLYSRGYREKSHFCLLVAIKAIFVEQDLLKIEYTDAFYAGMILRENADYRSDFSKSGALAVIRKAEEFLIKAAAILRN